MWSIMTGVRSHVEMQRKKFQCRQNDLPDWQAGQSISQSSQSVDRSVAVSSSFRERSLDRGQLLSSLSLSLSLGRWRQIYAWRDRFINWCAHCRRTSCCCCCCLCPCPVSPAPNWRQLRRRRTLRAVARLGGYFLIDIEIIYVCCLMSSHTQTQADGQTDRRMERQRQWGRQWDRSAVFLSRNSCCCFFFGLRLYIKSAETCGYQSLTWCGKM